MQPSLGRQPVARWYFPPEVDYRLSLLHPDAKGLVVWIMEAKVMQWCSVLYMQDLLLASLFIYAVWFAGSVQG